SWQLKRGAIGSINMAGSGNNSLQIVLEGRRKDALDLTSKGPLVDCAPEREHVAAGAASPAPDPSRHGAAGSRLRRDASAGP
ncbi:MAG TPA: hypothetical protein VIL09_19370, partial [Microvirga sp.]